MTLREFVINHSGRVLNVFDSVGDCIFEHIEGVNLANISSLISELNWNVLNFENTDSGMNVTIEYKEVRY